MTEVLSPPAPSSPSPSPSESTDLPAPQSQPRRPAPRERIPSYAQNRMSQVSHASQSRPSSTTPFPPFASSLPYSLVRDFAWPEFHPLHYGAPDPSSASGTTTPGSEYPSGGRRLSDPLDVPGAGGWSAGPWGGDGVMYGDPESTGEPEALPSTSFGGEDGDELGDETGGVGGKRKHRKSKSYANMTDYERGRRRESAGFRRSRASGEAGASDMFMFTGLQSDPAGRDSLRQSRGYVAGNPNTSGLAPHGSETGGSAGSSRARADSHFQTMLPNRSYPHRISLAPQQASSSSSLAQPPGTPFDPDTTIPLDTEPRTTSDVPQNLRESLGPEDEELYAGRSLALYPFEPENSNELRLREGQVIMVSYRHGQGWLVAEDPETGEQGLVPEEYVRLLSELPHYDPETGQFLDPEEGEDLGGEGPTDEDGEGDAEDGGVPADAEDDNPTPLASAGPGGGVMLDKQREKETRVDTPEAYELDAGDVQPAQKPEQ